jgi:uncharacterized protein (DUF1501 family)
MKRRDFLKAAAPTALLPITLGGFPIRAFGRNPFFDALMPLGNCDDHILVLIQLNGGNDGLNTVIPLDQYSAYYNARSNIAVSESQALKLSNATGLHPQLTALQQMYQNGTLSVVQSVGYPTPNFSHFRSTDIWLTASDYDEVLSTGWLGRYLEGEYPGFPVGYPNSTMPDPLAIQIGNIISPALDATLANMGMAFSNPTTFYNIIEDTTGAPSQDRTGSYINFIRDVGDQIKKFATPVKDAALRSSVRSSLWPAANQNPLADQLKIVSLLIAGGLKTKIYIVTLNGFDTHSSQNTSGSGTPYSHPQLLGYLSSAVNAFQDDLRLNNAADRVMGMTFSEFGRRIRSNSSGGTDHGAAAPVFIFGTNASGMIIGNNPIIPTSVDVEDNVAMSYDFRSVYASLLKEWFCADDTVLNRSLLRNFPIIPILKGSSSSSVTADQRDEPELIGIYPNPASNGSMAFVNSDGALIRLSIYDRIGAEVAVIFEKNLAAGKYTIPLETSSLASGSYYLRLQSGAKVSTRSLIITK